MELKATNKWVEDMLLCLPTVEDVKNFKSQTGDNSYVIFMSMAVEYQVFRLFKDVNHHFNNVSQEIIILFSNPVNAGNKYALHGLIDKKLKLVFERGEQLIQQVARFTNKDKDALRSDLVSKRPIQAFYGTISFKRRRREKIEEGIITRFEDTDNPQERDQAIADALKQIGAFDEICHLILSEVERMRIFWLDYDIYREAKKDQAYTSFAEIFVEPSDLALCISVLQNTDPPVVSNKGTWIGGKRKNSVIVAWIQVLELRGKIYGNISKVELSKLLNEYFLGLTMDITTASIFSKETTIGNRYHADFLANRKLM